MEVKMKKIDVGQAITILANIGVIAGIVFLAIEVQQNQASLDEANRINRAASLRTAVEYFNDIRMSVATDAELADIWSRGNSGEELDGLEASRFESTCQTLLWTYVMLYEQYRSLDQSMHLNGPLVSMRRDLQSPAIRQCWESRVKNDVENWGYSFFIEALESK
jgi:hypothetical protein